MKHRLVHFEFAGKDGESLEAFYRDLFGWAIKREDVGGMPYGRIAKGEAGPFTGGIRFEPEGGGETVLYFAVEDAKAAVDKAQKLGAKVRVPVMNFEGMTFAVMIDPAGNLIGLIEDKE